MSPHFNAKFTTMVGMEKLKHGKCMNFFFTIYTLILCVRHERYHATSDTKQKSLPWEVQQAKNKILNLWCCLIFDKA